MKEANCESLGLHEKLVPEASLCIGIAQTTLYKWIRLGRVPHRLTKEGIGVSTRVVERLTELRKKHGTSWLSKAQNLLELLQVVGGFSVSAVALERPEVGPPVLTAHFKEVRSIKTVREMGAVARKLDEWGHRDLAMSVALRAFEQIES
ncbi:hypothetical protein Bb109J_c1977 [Bdellovibrio bacteriovorus]|uniref:hypothetical protein n=1 Tax=Bdellovibrio bacteriovorus TaxID=959 RepID=UPI00045C094A|nr:hypothetical protein [Bdellovibrio bacteriovorus]AHZ84667.1 hypothetical protein EP01_06915 [Bdellovibrio bacteriovorus]BEV68557.1 hypothetical protein Bb109J_c1977 [Bdellovibrio bacteriovorus]